MTFTITPQSEFNIFAFGNGWVPDELLPKAKGQIQMLENAILEADSKLYKLRMKIGELKCVKDREEATKETFMSQLEAYRSLLSPFRRAPNEIIAKIIEFTLSNPYLLNYSDRRRLRMSISVCRRWRDAALQSPELWRGLDLVLPEDFRGTAEWDIPALLTMWFKRGGEGAPLRLKIKGDASLRTVSLFSPTPYITQFILSFIVGNPHWTELDISCFSTVITLEIVTSPSSFPTRRLALSFPSAAHAELPIERTVKLSGQTFPRLASLYLEGNIPRRLAIQLPSLVTLHLHNWTGHGTSLLSSLSDENLPQLRELVLEDLWLMFSNSAPKHHVLVHSTLERLVIIGSRTVNVLTQVSFPGLQTLRLCRVDYDQNALKDMVESFTAQLPDTFQTLWLEGSSLLPQVADLNAIVERHQTRIGG
ncbi:hypothetical protein FA15DRAFT_739579 [Coprinopsis marcescibilis]|uniref:Uncharacterized protein n=1 Tax=Coprinopsis marcescibilis TaxID=230819 RepID=A0A5C3KWA8_COPMA|nr:hypothetical protein FA15DRAFT_739579 [Coprinopsis marcescibilis]